MRETDKDPDALDAPVQHSAQINISGDDNNDSNSNVDDDAVVHVEPTSNDIIDVRLWATIVIALSRAISNSLALAHIRS